MGQRRQRSARQRESEIKTVEVRVCGGLMSVTQLALDQGKRISCAGGHENADAAAGLTEIQLQGQRAARHK